MVCIDRNICLHFIKLVNGYFVLIRYKILFSMTASSAEDSTTGATASKVIVFFPISLSSYGK